MDLEETTEIDYALAERKGRSLKDVSANSGEFQHELVIVDVNKKID